MSKLLTLILATGCGIGTYYAMAPVAYAQRGYMAYGGEVLLAIAVAMVVAYVGFALIRYKRKKREDAEI